ncbi:MAG TPA: ABC transporter permease [Acidimicrobiales bacterium]|nr:ABC transporter permease [Acidimicrobiales bacterium]
MTDLTTTARTITPRGRLSRRLRDIISYRELLANLVRKELKVRYKSSILGFLWSLLNPAMLLVVYYFVFSIVLKSGIPRFPIYLLSGLLVWNLFAVGLTAGTGSVVNNAGIVSKVWFPREVLPLGAIGAALVHFFLQSIVLVGALAIFRHPVDWAYLPLVPLALVGLLLLLSGTTILLAALNVYLRDVAHLVELLLLAWFFACPIVYSYDLIAERMGSSAFLYLANPVTDVVLVFQRAIYGELTDVVHDFPLWWYLRNLGYVYLVGAITFLVGMSVFRRLEGNFVEEL